jgi:hypothetical protein
VSLPSVSFITLTWNREQMLLDCIRSLLQQDYEGSIHCHILDDKSTDNTVGSFQQLEKEANASALARRVTYDMGPGYSNFRPGAIHGSFFHHVLNSDADYVGYQFSDDYCAHDRVRKQVEGMEEKGLRWSFCGTTHWTRADQSIARTQPHIFHRESQMVPAIGPTLPVYGFLVHRQSFIDVGGCDEPERAAACAEAWIVANCGLMGDAHVADTVMCFRVHPNNLGSTGRAGQKLYNEATAVTKMTEDDHWRLWREIEPVYKERVLRAQKLHD